MRGESAIPNPQSEIRSGMFPLRIVPAPYVVEKISLKSPPVGVSTKFSSTNPSIVADLDPRVVESRVGRVERRMRVGTLAAAELHRFRGLQVHRNRRQRGAPGRVGVVGDAAHVQHGAAVVKERARGVGQVAVLDVAAERLHELLPARDKHRLVDRPALGDPDHAATCPGALALQGPGVGHLAAPTRMLPETAVNRRWRLKESERR